MRNPITSRNAAFFAAGGFVAALFIAGAAHAITSTIFQYSAPKTGYLTLHPGGFVRYGSNIGNDYSIYSEPPSLTTTGPACFLASVNLPNGAMITEAAAWFSSAQGTGSYFFDRSLLSSSTYDRLFIRYFHDTSGTEKGVAVPVSKFNVVDNAHYAYGLTVCLGSNGDTFYGARLIYKYDNAGS